MGLGRAYDAITNLAQQKGLIRPRDVASIGYSRTWLEIFGTLGILRSVGPRIFSLPEHVPLETAVAHACASQGVVCLISALWVHGFSSASLGGCG